MKFIRAYDHEQGGSGMVWVMSIWVSQWHGLASVVLLPYTMVANGSEYCVRRSGDVGLSA